MKLALKTTVFVFQNSWLISSACARCAASESRFSRERGSPKDACHGNWLLVFFRTPRWLRIYKFGTHKFQVTILSHQELLQVTIPSHQGFYILQVGLQPIDSINYQVYNTCAYPSYPEFRQKSYLPLRDPPSPLFAPRDCGRLCIMEYKWFDDATVALWSRIEKKSGLG